MDYQQQEFYSCNQAKTYWLVYCFLIRSFSETISTYTVEITLYVMNQRSPAEGKGKGQKLIAQGIALG